MNSWYIMLTLFFIAAFFSKLGIMLWCREIWTEELPPGAVYNRKTNTIEIHPRQAVYWGYR